MDERNYEVYRHTNLTNGKVYIGASRNGWESRWKKRYRNNEELHDDISATEASEWTHEVLASGLSREEAMSEELRQIELNNATDKSIGYNKESVSSGLLNEEDTEKMIKALHQKMSTEEYLSNLSAAMKRVWEGRTDEEREVLLGRLRLSNEQQRQAFEKMTAEEQAEVIERRRDASRRGKETLRERLRSDPEYAKELHDRLSANSKKIWENPVYRAAHTKPEWEKKRYVPVPADVAHRHRVEAQKRKWSDPAYKEKMRVKMAEVWTEERKAEWSAALTGAKRPDDVISRISVSQKKTWESQEYRRNRKPFDRPENANVAASETLSARMGKPVYCLETGETYRSIGEASRVLECNQKVVKAVLGGKRKSTHGYHFRYADGEMEEKNPCVGVVCVETGVVYSSMKEAATATGATSSGISQCCKGKRKICAGYHWRYAD